VSRLSPAAAVDSPQFWDARARRFAARFPGPARNDPFLARVRRAVGRTRSVIDVGSGPGRFALALAPRAKEVVAVDPSKEMLAHLRRRCRGLGIDNIRLVHGKWQDVNAPTVDVGLCSYVLPIIDDAAGFLTKLDACCRERAFLYLGAMSTDAVFDPFWRHFHGTPRRPGPTYLDAVAVLEELGVEPQVEVVEVTTGTRFKSLAAAVGDYRENLLLPDDAEVRRELRALLRTWLVEQGGELRAPVRSMPAAVISWDARGGS
jgi:SAM-dependent methyltransferase